MFKNIFTQVPKDTWNTNKLYETSLTKDLIDLDTCAIALHPAATTTANIKMTVRLRDGRSKELQGNSLASGDVTSLMLFWFITLDDHMDIARDCWYYLNPVPDFFVRGIQISTDQPLIYGPYASSFSSFIDNTFVPELLNNTVYPSNYTISAIATSGMTALSPYVRYLDIGHHHLPEVY